MVDDTDSNKSGPAEGGGAGFRGGKVTTSSIFGNNSREV
jgi:hypothetical protein